MNDVVPTFPLLQLPINAIMNTLRSMTHLEIIGISILSKKTKNLAESLDITAMSIHVYIFNSFNVCLNFPNDSWLNFKLYEVLENEPLQELETPGSICITTENVKLTWKNVMSVKQLLDHFQCIFHTSIKILCFGPNCERLSLESIQKNVRDFQSICLMSENHENNRRVVSFFQPAELDLLDHSFDDGHVPRYISIQNLDVIRALSVDTSLDDLLMTNARSMKLICDRLSTKIPNQFLKLWIKGSNPRLEYMHLLFRNADFQEKELLIGLKHQDASQNKRRFINVSMVKGTLEVIGGWDIWRTDGTQATFSIELRDDLVIFEFYVWHDHCIVY